MVLTGLPFFISLTETPLLVTAYFNPSILSNSFGNELKALPLDGTKQMPFEINMPIVSFV